MSRLEVITYCSGYSPDMEQRDCVYSYWSNGRFNVVMYCTSQAEAKEKEMKFNNFLKKYRLKNKK